MSDDSWRAPARVIAYIDLVLPIVAAAVIACTLCVIAALKKTMERDGVMDKAAKLAYYTMWISVLIGAVVVSINIWAVVELIQATSEDIHPVEALRKSQIWFTLTIVLMVLTILNSLSTRDKRGAGNGILTFALRAYFLYVVDQYRNELRAKLNE